MSAADAAASSAAASKLDAAPPAPASAPDSTAAATHAATTTTATNTNTDTLLQLFIALPDVCALYHDAAGRYLTATKELKTARLSLEKFRTTCNKGNRLTLPRSMQLRVVERAKLPVVPDVKTFNDATTATLRSIEAATTKSIYDALLVAKEAHISHLEQRANAHAFIITAVTAHRAHVSAYAAQLDASLHFPLEAAVIHFEQHLRRRVQELNLQAVSTAMREQKDAAAHSPTTARHRRLS